MKINQQIFDRSIILPHLHSFAIRGNSNIYWCPLASNIDSTVTQTNTAIGLDTLCTYPFVVGNEMRIVEMVSRINSGASAGRTYRIGIYTDNGNGYPNQLVNFSDTGTISAATTGTKTATFSNIIRLQKGLYWLVTNASNATPTLRTFDNIFVFDVLGTDSSNVDNVGWSVAFTYAAMPQQFPTGATIHQKNIPIVGFKTINY